MHTIVDIVMDVLKDKMTLHGIQMLMDYIQPVNITIIILTDTMLVEFQSAHQLQ